MKLGFRHLALLITLVAAVGLTAGALARQPVTVAQTTVQTPHRAALVVRFGDGKVQDQCVTFTEPEITGYQLLRSSTFTVTAAEMSGLGAAICKINNDGCDPGAGEDCFCKSGEQKSWSFWVLEDGVWVYSRAGAGTTKVTDGTVQGWVWGATSASEPANAKPPLRTFEEICGKASDTTPIAPTTTVTTTPTPTEVVTATVTTTPTETATATATHTATAIATRVTTPTTTSTATPVPTPSMTSIPTLTPTVTPVPGNLVGGGQVITGSIGTPLPTAVPPANSPIALAALPVATVAVVAVATAPAPTLAPTPVPLSTATLAPTPTALPTLTPIPTHTSTSTPTATPRATFGPALSSTGVSGSSLASLPSTPAPPLTVIAEVTSELVVVETSTPAVAPVSTSELISTPALESTLEPTLTPTETPTPLPTPTSPDVLGYVLFGVIVLGLFGGIALTRIRR